MGILFLIFYKSYFISYSSRVSYTIIYTSASFFIIHFIYLVFNFYCYSITVICLSPHPSTPPQPDHPPSPTSTLPLDLIHVSFIPSSHCPLPTPPAIVRLFLTSISLVIFCLLFSFVDYVPVKGEIIGYLSLTAWLISLSIMLSSSIHAVAKGISSFFLSAV